jgi:hypothetical protein
MLERIHPQNPIEAIDESYKSFTLAMRLQGGFSQGLIDQKCFTNRTEIPSDIRMPIPGQTYNDKVIYRQLHNLVLSSTAALIIAVDTALDETFGHKNPLNAEDPVDALRAIIYMLRCAWSHDMVNPKWELKGDKYRRKYQVTVPEEIISDVSLGHVVQPQTYALDFAELDGKFVELAPFRGIEGIIFLTSHAKELISKKLGN